MGLSLYGQYIKEREGKSILEKDYGFATYVINGQECYIEDIYVVPEMRKKHVASELANEVVEIAKAKGCTVLTGTVSPTAKGATESLKVLLAYGFQLHSCRPDLIIFAKEIK